MSKTRIPTISHDDTSVCGGRIIQEAERNEKTVRYMDFADDLGLVPQKPEDLKVEPANWQKKRPVKIGLQANVKKVEEMKITNQQQQQQQKPATIFITGIHLKEVISFV